MLIAPKTPGKQDVAYSIPFYKNLKSEQFNLRVEESPSTAHCCWRLIFASHLEG